MPRITPVPIEAAEPVARRYMEADLAQHGQVLPGTGLYAHTPTILEGTKGLNAGITAAGGIDQQLRMLMNVRVASIVGCPF